MADGKGHTMPKRRSKSLDLGLTGSSVLEDESAEAARKLIESARSGMHTQTATMPPELLARMEAEYGTGDALADALIPPESVADPTRRQRMTLRFAASSGAAKLMLGVGVAMASTTGLVATGHAPGAIQHAAEKLIPALKDDAPRHHAPASHSRTWSTGSSPTTQTTTTEAVPQTTEEPTCETGQASSEPGTTPEGDAAAAGTSGDTTDATTTSACVAPTTIEDPVPEVPVDDGTTEEPTPTTETTVDEGTTEPKSEATDDKTTGSDATSVNHE